MVEYALLIALIALAGIVGVRSVGTSVSGKFTQVAGGMELDYGQPVKPP